MFIWTLRVNLCRVQLHYGTVFLFFHWLLPSCARHWDKNRPIIQFNTDPVLSGQLRYCSRTELSNVCACAETGEVWGRSNDRLRKDFLNNVTFWRFKVANDDVADMCSTLFSPAIFKIYSSQCPQNLRKELLGTSLINLRLKGNLRANEKSLLSWATL